MTVDGCIKAEESCGQSLVKIAMRLSEGDLSIIEVSNVLTPALRGGGNNVTSSAVTKIVYEAGMAESLAVCGKILTNVITAGKGTSDDGEEKNVEQMLPDNE